MSHFALTPEDLLPALALALLAGQRGSRAGRLALFALPAAWLLGGLAGLAFPTISSATALTTVSFLALGGLVAAEARLRPEWVTRPGRSSSASSTATSTAPPCRRRSSAPSASSGIVSTLFVVVALAAALVVALRVAVGAHRRARGRQLDRRDRAAAARLVAPGDDGLAGRQGVASFAT